MVSPISTGTVLGSDPTAAVVLFIVLFILPALGYAVWFVAEWRRW